MQVLSIYLKHSIVLGNLLTLFMLVIKRSLLGNVQTHQEHFLHREETNLYAYPEKWNLSK